MTTYTVTIAAYRPAFDDSHSVATRATLRDATNAAMFHLQGPLSTEHLALLREAFAFLRQQARKAHKHHDCRCSYSTAWGSVDLVRSCS